ncbi:hypothetical protein EMB92_00625 [Bifidobacterium callitrichos]|uniref:Uncharacterized protein n=1 Tax=Bifidobacterium callitrichos TaxID=762209 RepID=A0A5M9ZDU3_9BIFI|nr:hypothetical protein [Bifidobacterium callitrichos]KAA8817139.1 hypothetical protein EMB92_00625 [Bifidobacterium callitrichos]
MTAAHIHTNVTPLTRLATAYAELMQGFFAACRRWTADHIARPDEENWFAMWIPASASQIV